jgi:hypothetical protein
MPVTVRFEVFQRGDADFPEKADAAMASLELLPDQINSVEDNLNAKEASAAEAAVVATQKAAMAEDNAELTAADVVATAADREATTADALATAADRVQTGYDRIATADTVEAVAEYASAANLSAVEAAGSAAVILQNFTPVEGGVTFFEYDNRDDLRLIAPVGGGYCLVELLGLFRHVAASDEPDDDETCFVTVSGAWLLEVPAWDFIDANRIFEDSDILDRLENLDHL